MCYNVSLRKPFNYFYLVKKQNYTEISKDGKKNAYLIILEVFIINLKP